MRYVLLAAILLFAVSSAFAADIVTVPTANQLRAGQFDVADYYLGLDMPIGAPQNVQAQTLYVGLTDRFEVDAHRYDVDTVGDSTIVNASVLLLHEDSVQPDVAIGGRNLFQEQVTDERSKKRSGFIVAAKTLNLPEAGPPALPIVRLHAALGTADYTLLNEKRHEGLFGGVQMLLKPEIGAIALYDGQDVITGLTYTPKGYGITAKVGTFGKHWWAGLSFSR